MENLREIVRENIWNLTHPRRWLPRAHIALPLIGILGLLGPFLNLYLLQVLIYAMLLGVVAMSNDLLYGYSGVFSITPLVFYAIGGFAAGLLTGGYHPYVTGSFIGLQINPWLSILLAGLLTGTVGAAISFPSLRLKRVYIGLLMIVFSSIFTRLVVNEVWLTGGQIGFQLLYTLPGVPDVRISYYYLVLALFAVTFIVLSKFVNSRIGLALRALGDNELAAKQLGVSIVKYRLISFFVAAFFMGLAGSMYAFTFKYINESMGDLFQSFLVVVMSIFGGVGTLVGPFIGALIYIIMAESLRFLELWRYVVFGIVIIVVTIFLPRGIVGTLLQYLERRKSIRLGAQDASCRGKSE